MLHLVEGYTSVVGWNSIKGYSRPSLMKHDSKKEKKKKPEILIP